ncbi:glycerate kinase [Ramlibacter sp. PS4R-6]|uniref:glycerate kinase n=1 Tax=Ramlibacter sp. PS4R-6 TaxID=3133438 RepID=UPI0030B24D9E
MDFQKIVLPILGAVLVAIGWRIAGWGGVALAVGAMVMYLLLHFNRMMAVLQKAANRPKGYVGSAVMLNAKLKPGVNMLHVMALTNSLGEPLSPQGQQPEVFRWTDGTGSHVTCDFANGRLVKWDLYRPPAEEDAPAAPAP